MNRSPVRPDSDHHCAACKLWDGEFYRDRRRRWRKAKIVTFVTRAGTLRLCRKCVMDAIRDRLNRGIRGRMFRKRFCDFERQGQMRLPL